MNTYSVLVASVSTIIDSQKTIVIYINIGGGKVCNLPAKRP